MAFRFSLEKILDHRKIKENIAQKEFQEARYAIVLEEDRLSEMRSVLASSYRLSQEQLGARSQLALIQAYEFQIGQRERIKLQEQKIKDLEVILESKRQALLALSIDRRVIEKHRENKEEEFNFEERKAEADTTDEANVLRHRFRNRKSDIEE